MELTFAAEGELDGSRLRGVVHVFGTRGMKEGVYHRFAPTAFDKSLASGTIFAFYHHDPTKPLASTANGKLRVAVVGKRFTYDMELGEQSYAQDLRINAREGLMTEMSFGVYPRKWTMTRDPDGHMVMDHTEADIFEISPVTRGTFDKTSAQLHAASAEWSRSQAVRARARVAEAYR